MVAHGGSYRRRGKKAYAASGPPTSLTARPSTIDLSRRLGEAYVTMKRTQATVPPEYSPHETWGGLLEVEWAQARSAIEAQQWADFDAFLRNFFRNGGISGLWGSGSMFRKFIEADPWADMVRTAAFLRQFKAWQREALGGKLEDLDQPRVGNPCPSWIHIELCAVLRSPLFGEFWRMSGSCVSPPKQHGSCGAGSVSVPTLKWAWVLLSF